VRRALPCRTSPTLSELFERQSERARPIDPFGVAEVYTDALAEIEHGGGVVSLTFSRTRRADKLDGGLVVCRVLMNAGDLRSHAATACRRSRDATSGPARPRRAGFVVSATPERHETEESPAKRRFLMFRKAL